MKLEEIRKIAVIGAGLMEGQIAELLSRLRDYEGNLVDLSDELMTKGLESM
jgi:3-hydroxyacyl-CoA dehydrogenase